MRCAHVSLCANLLWETLIMLYNKYLGYLFNYVTFRI